MFIFFHFPDSSPSVLNGLQFYFSLRDSTHRKFFLSFFGGREGGEKINKVFSEVANVGKEKKVLASQVTQ